MLQQIADIVEEMRCKYPIIGKELDGRIYYMNGNDGTDFDWDCNERVCEFMVFHENEMGYIKLMVYNDNLITIYVYADGGWKPTYELERKYKGSAKALKNYLYRTFDKNDLWDGSIEEYI